MSNNTALQLRADNQQLEALKRIAEQATPRNEIRVRQGRGGMQLKYTDGAYVIRTLNQAFGWDWDFVADSEELLLNNGKPFEVKVRGTLTVRLGGQAVTKTQYGCQPIEMLRNGESPVSIGDAYKGAATDAMKKCASLLGIALDLYDSDSEVNTGRPKPPPAPPVQPARQAQPTREPEPMEVYEAERAQPTFAPLPELQGAAGHVIALARKLKWDEAEIIALIQQSFGTVVIAGQLKGYLEFATKDELRELYRIMNSGGGKK